MKRIWNVFVGAAAMTVAWLCGAFVCSAVAADWPVLGRDGTRNNVSAEVGAPTQWSIEERQDDRVIRETRGIRWSAPLGSQTHSSPVVSGGLVWIGTNNVRPGDEGGGNGSVLKCFRITDGKQVYEYLSPQLGPRIHDPGWTGLGSSPLIEGDRLWLTTNRSEVLCWDIGPLIRGEGTPRELWKLDLIKALDIFPHIPLMGPPRPCSIGPSWNGRLFVTTNNGVGEDHTKVPKPDAPSLVCLNKETGEVYWKDNSPGANILVTQFASPTVAEIRGQVQVIVPQSDGWVRAFDPMTGEKLWEFDINAKETLYSPYARGVRNSLLGNAVVYEDRVYLASGRDVEQGEGAGRLVCIDPTKRGDVSSELAVDANDKPLPRRRVQAVDPKAGEKAIANPNSALAWEFVSSGTQFEDAMHRSMNSVAIAKGLVIVGDLSGLVHCFDAKTGQRHWRHDMFAAIWTSPLIVDDKVYVADEDGDVTIFGLSADPDVALPKVDNAPQPLHEISMVEPIYSSPIFANGVLYLATRTTLFAIVGDKDQQHDPELTGGNWPQWRGPNRDNISTDTKLMKEWPAAGPPLRWRMQGLGDGISPVSIAGGRVFALCQYEAIEYVRAVHERTGQHLWTTALGASLRLNPLMRWLTQRPATVDGERLYAISLLGELACLRTADGKELWRKNYSTDFAGKRSNFGFADCPVVDGDKLICTPGGADAAVVALDKKTGKVLWKCAVPDAGRATYGNGVVVTIDGQRQFVTFLEKALVSVAVDDGKLLWRFNGPVDQTHTPIVRDRTIMCLNSFGTGIRLLEVKRDKDMFVVQDLYSKSSGFLARFQDDTVVAGDRVYEPANGVFSCFEWKNGNVVWQKRMGPTFTTTFADGHFYFHADDGQMRLIEPAPTELLVKSEFVLPDHKNSLGTTTPIVTGGRLYVREDDQLFCYDVRVEAAKLPPTEALHIILAAPDAKLATELQERTLRSVFVPTPQDVVEKMLELAEVKKSDIVYDLGSGDGRILISAARTYCCRAIGYELDKELVDSSRAKAEAAGVKSLVAIEHKDLFTADLSDADVLAVYLLPQQLTKLLPMLVKMKPGSRIVSHQFEIPGVPPDKTLRIRSNEDGQEHTMSLWTLPLPLHQIAIRSLAGQHQDIVTMAVFSPNGEMLASTGEDGNVVLWNWREGQAIRVLKGHVGGVLLAVFSPDGKTLATGGRDAKVILWDVNTGAQRTVIDDHTAAVSAVIYSQDGKTFATGSDDRLVKVRDSDGKLRFTLAGHQQAVIALTLSADAKSLVSAGGNWNDPARQGEVKVWDLEKRTERWSAAGEFGGIWGVDLSPDGKQVAGASLDGTVRIWGSESGDVRSVLKGHTNRALWVAYAPGGRWLVSSGLDGIVRFWDAVSPKAKAVGHVESIPVQRFAFSPVEKVMATAGSDRKVTIWRILEGRSQP